MDVNELQTKYSELHEQYAGVLAEKSLLEAELERLKLKIEVLNHRLFGKSSERRDATSCDQQPHLFEVPVNEKPAAQQQAVTVASHTRRARQDKVDDEEEAPEGTFPAHLRRKDVIVDEKPAGVGEDDLELLDEKVTERLAEDPAEPYVKRIVRRVYKQKSSGKIHTPAAPAHVFGRCKVDESFLVNMVVKNGLPHEWRALR